jgi:hypothetical protein
MNRREMRVYDGRHGPRLTPQSHFISRDHGRQGLECDVAAEIQVYRAVHHTHAASANPLQHPELARHHSRHRSRSQSAGAPRAILRVFRIADLPR